jgi:DNA-binding GntR family transcriptional regulator
MRVAIGRLVTENLVERFAGRGTFVKQPADRRKFLLDRSFTRQMAEMGLKASSKVLDCSPGEVDESAPAPLHKYMGTACLNLIRLRLGDGHPSACSSPPSSPSTAPTWKKTTSPPARCMKF